MTEEGEGKKPEGDSAESLEPREGAEASGMGAPPSGDAVDEERTTKDEEPVPVPDQEPTAKSQEPSPAPPATARIDYDEATLQQYVEALLFVAQRPLTVAQVARPLRTTFAAVRRAFRALGELYADRGVRLAEVGGGWQLRTAPECADVVRRFLDVKPLRLSKAAMETLAVVAYRQPCTKPDVDEIRGVDSGSAVKLLLDRNLVRVLGRKEEPGRPLLYGTTQPFLEFFGLGNLNDLPSLREYAELSEDGRRQLERDLFARAPEPVSLAGDDLYGGRPAPRHWEDLVEVLGDDIGGLPEGVEVEVEPESTGDPLRDYVLTTKVPGAAEGAPQAGAELGGEHERERENGEPDHDSEQDDPSTSLPSTELGAGEAGDDDHDDDHDDHDDEEDR
jgi:segregation and condensation protein B